ncbi:unnamed protein product [Mytilus coruscus]|uniref:LRRCT domain-containing protein n=1 Tax=Mytilus coruscus TaxID=42192 RepID=A0A6J8EYY3_MYTCO|nr:unnamed protein product [Mytilus coruscus]
MLDLSQDYSAELFLPIQNLTTLDISNNMKQSDDVTRFNYPDHEISVLRELSFLSIDMMSNPKFRHGFSRITYLKELHFQSCYLKRLERIKRSWHSHHELLKPMTNLTYLYLSQNLLSSVSIQLTGHSYINTLDVRNNLLTCVSSTITNWADRMQELHGMTLNLDGNAFECNCDTIDFIRWIQTTKVNLDSRSYICKLSNGTVIDTLMAYNYLHDLFVDWKSTMWLTLASSLLSTCVTISLLLVVYSKRWKILFSIYGIIRRTVEREVRKSYHYDV